ncbi:MAG: succinate dehydrogenase cytochrome b subunit [Oligoflexia bacterium]|nr:succinate dehydrogenase cytochrome b subunit [Oligoflexia bacterium]
MGCCSSNNNKFYYCSSSIGKKQLMAISAVMLVGFSIAHMIGNVLIYFGPKYINLYGYHLTSNLLLPLAELLLASIFIVHIIFAVILVVENYLARPVKYHMKVNSGRGANFASATMPWTGAIMLVFLIFHLINFRFGTIYMTSYDGIEVRDVYRLLIEFFSNPLNLVLYVTAMIAFAFHLGHGIQSIFQTVGINSPKYTPCIQKLCLLLSLVLSVMFSTYPIWSYIKSIQ